MIIFSSGYNEGKANPPKKEKSNQKAELVLDCNTIAIYDSVTSDCCVIITSSWTRNPTGMSVEFEQMNSSGNYVFVGSSGLPAKHKFCPNPGETVVNYRLKWFNSEHYPACTWDQNWIENYNQYTRTYDLSCCGCPSGINDWLTVSSKKSNLCLENGCKYEYTLTIPESNNCFTNYKLDNGQLTSITNKTISGNGCIPASSSKSIKFTLLKANGDSCVISKDVTCAAKKDSNSLPTPCMPDCFNIPWTIKTEFKIVNGCQGFVTYAYRNACGTQDLEIIKMDYDPNCLNNSTVESIYKNLLYKIIKNNNMGFQPTDSGCATTWRIIQSGCWSHYYLYTMSIDTTNHIGVGGPNYKLDSSIVYEPCEGSECCLQRITVCRFKNPDRITISYNNPNNTSVVNCYNSWLEDPYTSYIYPCEPKCIWLENLYAGPMTINYEDNTPTIQSKLTSVINTFQIGVNVQIIDNLLSLMIKNHKSENAEFLIMDINGKVIHKSNIKLNENNNYFNLRLNEYNNGTYIYSIIVDGLFIKSDKFLITK